jgi:hypothetical protein
MRGVSGELFLRVCKQQLCRMHLLRFLSAASGRSSLFFRRGRRRE